MTRFPLFLMICLSLAACGTAEQSAPQDPSAEAAAAGEYERGPNRGRMLRDGDFAIEVTIFEENAPPHYRLYAYEGDTPVAPQDVQATIRLKRLDGEVNDFSFKPEGEFLTGNGEVTEPHSFDVEVRAQHAGKSHEWVYESYEGRTTIPAAAAEAAGVEVEVAGPQTIRDTVRLMGTVALDANRHAQVKARFPGTVRSVNVEQGQRVRRGQTLLTVEGNDSMRTYPVTAPLEGIVITRNTNVGDVADANVLVEIADVSTVWVELRALGADAERLAVGQPVEIGSATGAGKADATIETLLPLASGQSVVARASIENPEGRWRPGMMVTADVTVDEEEVPLAVREAGLQRFRDFTVVFAQVGDTYEVRMLELGDRDGRHVEVLGGLKPGTRYVTEQSFLMKADVEKSGASHDH